MTNKQLVTEVRAVEKTAPRLAEKAVHRQRQHARKGVQKDLKERLARKEKEDEEERKVRDDRVRQIRALEKVLHKAGESLAFSSDDSRELTAWANDLTNVHKALTGVR